MSDSQNPNPNQNMINGIDTTGMHPDTVKAIRQYSTGYRHPQQDWKLSQNGLARTREMVERAGLSREQARQDPRMMMLATLRAMAEQRGPMPTNEGISGRNGLDAAKAARTECTGRSLADMANTANTTRGGSEG